MFEDILAQLGRADTYIALASIVAMLIVLDIDNVVFMTIVSTKLKPEEQKRAIRVGLLLGIGIRVVLLLLVGELTKMETPLFSLDLGQSYHNEFTVKVIVTLVGGLFLIVKAVREIHDKLEGPDATSADGARQAKFWQVIGQVSVLNIIFSVDSVITAVGMTNHLWLMCVASAVSVLVILFFAYPISQYVQRHPTMKMLGLAFLLLIGVLLVTEALHVEIPKGYVYFAMAFALVVEFLNIQVRRKGVPVKLHMYSAEDLDDARDGHPDLRHRAGNDPLQ
jgi:predicted tellurium resistance membrane protein TerC